MTVKQLIEELQKMPQDMIVINGESSQEVDIVEENNQHFYDIDTGKFGPVVVMIV